MKTEYHFYTDPGHGWLRVPLADRSDCLDRLDAVTERGD